MMRPTINEESDCLRKKNLRRRCGWIARKFHVYISSRKRSFWNCRMLESVCAEKIFHRYDSVFFSDSFGHKHREIYWSGSSDVSSYETTKKNTFEVSYFILDSMRDHVCRVIIL